MIALLLILIPVFGGLIGFLLQHESKSKTWALLVSSASLLVMAYGMLGGLTTAETAYDAPWLGQLGASFSLKMDGISAVLCLLTVISYPLILLSTWNNSYNHPAAFYALLLLAQAGIMGVFLTYDGLLFYFFWELALIPVYFLSSICGGARRIAVTFKFFIYTFI
ncbi:MAG: NADH-quinone oxidoreductase subunit M, partial [Chitinophagaceae bacterium]